MRIINEIIIHCSATRIDQDVSAEAIHQYHRDKGWLGIGYHFYVRKDGTVIGCRPIELAGAHTEGRNKHTIGICYEGGLVRMNDNTYQKDTRTPAQISAMYNLIRTLLHCYPSIKRVSGHRDYNATACPCFDASAEYEKIVEDIRKCPVWNTKSKSIVR